MNEREQQRKVRHRLAVIRHAAEVTGNVAATCRYYGISRPTFYKWLRRYEEVGDASNSRRSQTRSENLGADIGEVGLRVACDRQGELRSADRAGVRRLDGLSG